MTKYLWRMKTHQQEDFLLDNNNNNNNHNWNSRKLTKSNKVITHNELIERIQKTFYYGNDKCLSSSKGNGAAAHSSSSSPSLKHLKNDESLINTMGNKSSRSRECHQIITKPFAMYAAELFSDTHKGYSLNRLNYMTVCNNVEATPCSLLLAIIYLERLCDTDPLFTRCITPTELFLVSMMVSTKFYSGYDEEIYISQWASQGNLTVKQLKKLELQFLTAINWNVYVSNEEFFKKLKSIELKLAAIQGIARGWLTYTELPMLLPTLAIAKTFLQYSTIFLISYAAGVVTIAGAFLIASHCPGTSLYTSPNVDNVNQCPSNTETVMITPSSNETQTTTTNNLNLEYNNGCIINRNDLLDESYDYLYRRNALNISENIDRNFTKSYLPRNGSLQMMNTRNDVDQTKETSIIVQMPAELMRNNLNIPEIGIRTGGIDLRMNFLKKNTNHKRIRKIVNQNNDDHGDGNDNDDEDDDEDNNNFTYYNFYNEYKSLVQKLQEDHHHHNHNQLNNHHNNNDNKYRTGLFYNWLRYFY